MLLEADILNKYRNIAVIGASSNPERPSYIVVDYLMKHGYHVMPVNPNEQKILGKTSYPNLSAIPEKVQVVDIFRRPEDVMPIVDEAIKIGAKVVWMQEGVINEEAAARAREAGLLVVMDKCMRKQHISLMQRKKRKNGG
jgi:predicted CoA-binding protein